MAGSPTSRQRRFVEEYLLTLDVTNSMIKAGYDKKWANGNSANLMKSKWVKEQIAKGMKARAKRTGIDADWVLKRLRQEADADLADLYNDDGTLKPMKEWPVIWRKGLVQGLETTEAASGSVINKIKISDRIKRIELIGRHVDVQAWLDRTESVEQKSEEEMYGRLVELLGGDSEAKTVVNELFGEDGIQRNSTRH